MSPPLFPRAKLEAKDMPLGDDMENIKKLVGDKMEIDDDDFDVGKESFAVVNGWSEL